MRKTMEHASDCAVHNEPAYRAGPCNCGAELKAERRYVAWLSRCAYNRAAYLGKMLRIRAESLFHRSGEVSNRPCSPIDCRQRSDSSGAKNVPHR